MPLFIQVGIVLENGQATVRGGRRDGSEFLIFVYAALQRTAALTDYLYYFTLFLLFFFPLHRLTLWRRERIVFIWSGLSSAASLCGVFTCSCHVAC